MRKSINSIQTLTDSFFSSSDLVVIRTRLHIVPNIRINKVVYRLILLRNYNETTFTLMKPAVWERKEIKC